MFALLPIFFSNGQRLDSLDLSKETDGPVCPEVATASSLKGEKAGFSDQLWLLPLPLEVKCLGTLLECLGRTGGWL